MKLNMSEDDGRTRTWFIGMNLQASVPLDEYDEIWVADLGTGNRFRLNSDSLARLNQFVGDMRVVKLIEGAITKHEEARNGK